MAKRWSANVRRWVYRYLVSVSATGEKCFRCQEPPGADRPLEIHHVDLDRNNDAPDNLALACGDCNKFLSSPRAAAEALIPARQRQAGRSRERRNGHAPAATIPREGVPTEGESERELANQYSTMSPTASHDKPTGPLTEGSAEYQASASYEPMFRAWIFHRVEEEGHLLVKEAIYGGAEYTHASPLTTRRYLEKLTSLQGPLAVVQDNQNRPTLVLRPGY